MPYISYSIKCGVCDGVTNIRVGSISCGTATKPEDSPLVLVNDKFSGLQVGFQCPKCPKPITKYLPHKPS